MPWGFSHARGQLGGLWAAAGTSGVPHGSVLALPALSPVPISAALTPPLPPALTYHYETQCIPTPGAWFAHQLPVWFQKFSVVATYVIEIAVPVLFFAPARRLRLFAFYCQVWGQSRDPCPTPAAVGLTWVGGQEPPSTVPPPALPPLPLRCCCSSSSSSRVTTTSSMHSPSSWPSHCWTRSTWGAGWAAPGGDTAVVRPPCTPLHGDGVLFVVSPGQGGDRSLSLTTQSGCDSERDHSGCTPSHFASPWRVSVPRSGED